MRHLRFFLLFLISSTRTTLCLNNRHVCFLNKYSDVRGPYFAALFDQIFEQTGVDNNNRKRVAFIATNEAAKKTATSINNAKPDNKGDESGDTIPKEELIDDLGLDTCEYVFLNEYNPISLREKIDEIDPTIIWVTNAKNSFLLRYYMKITNFDGIIEELCGSKTPEDEEDITKSLLYVGEGAGAICGGATLAVGAKAIRGENPKESPEPQFFGLKLLGPDRSVFFLEDDKDEANNEKLKSKFKDSKSVSLLNKHQIYVFSQQGTDVTSFIMNANQRGSLQGFSSPEPVPPLYVDVGGRKCTGEPSIDPSRMIQMTKYDESELWWDEDI